MDNLVTVWKFSKIELGLGIENWELGIEYWELRIGNWYANQILKEFLTQSPLPSPQSPIFNTQSTVKKNWDLRSAL
ncbi:MAG: hypothetical protein V7L20_00355 [Nostoc sp.]|uniref:hypothetical protein n=1 Tax=Nostoc sp. TaxID=1180 RepID=UPI002FF990FB